MSVHWKHAPEYRSPRPQRYTDAKFNAPIDSNKDQKASRGLTGNMAYVSTNLDGEATFTVKAPNDGLNPVFCLFSDVSFGGNVWCVGIGGGGTLPQWKHMAQSVSCYAGANMWLYAKEYGDVGGALIKGDVEDLKNKPYGKGQGSFSQYVKALWVLKGWAITATKETAV